jgi:hypothetical protein
MDQWVNGPSTRINNKYNYFSYLISVQPQIYALVPALASIGLLYPIAVTQNIQQIPPSPNF